MIRNSVWILLTLGVATGCGGPLDDGSTEESSAIETGTQDGTNGATNGAPNGATNGAPNGATNGAPNGVTNGAPNGATNGETGEGLRLSSFHESIFVEEGCTSGYCHGSFQLDSPQAVVDAFVNVEAPRPVCGRSHYVVPGNPEESILWVRVRPITDEDVECEVIKMPKGSETGLDEEDAQFIYDWIADGALL